MSTSKSREGERLEYDSSDDEVRPISTSTADTRPAWSRRSSYKFKWFIYGLLGIHAFLYTWLMVFSERLSPAYVSPDLLGASSIMWLIAHPDDESMFFAPSLLNLISRHDAPNGTHITPAGHILSMSSGNNDGLGAQRTVEMRAACLMYKISPENCLVMDQERLPDDPNIWWPEDVIEYWVRTYIEKWTIDTIITFDESGVSGHANHRALSAAMTKTANVDLHFPKVFTLRTTRSVLSKYSALMLYPYVRISHRWRMNHPPPTVDWDPDVHPIANQKHGFLSAYPEFTPMQLRHGYAHPFATHDSLLINSPWQYLQGRGAFKQHKTQVLWFRRLYMFFSRYMWFNELEKVVPIHVRVVDVSKVRQAQKDAL